MSDRFDQVLVDRDEIRPILVVNKHIGQANEEAGFFVDRVGNTISHRRDQEVAHVGAIDRPYTNADFLALGHNALLPPRRLSLAFSAQKLLSLAQLLILMLAHFLSALLQNAGHAWYLLRGPSLKAFQSKCKLTVCLFRMVYSRPMDTHRYSLSRVSLFAWLLLCAFVSAGCPSKKIQYPEEHARLLHLDQALDSLQNVYQGKDRSGFHSLLLPSEQMEELQRQAEMDFDGFHAIALEFKIERVMLEKENMDVFVNWQGTWKKDANDMGMRQRGHARLQWAGTPSLLLRAVQGDLPFGMKTKQQLSESSSPPIPPQ